MKTKFKDTLKEDSDLELTDKMEKLKKDLFSLRFQASTGHLEDTSRMRTVRRNIATIKTIIRARELKIVKEPSGGK
jgi:large subunit ribosomal protein L29